MNNNYFYFNKKKYYAGTIVKIKEESQQYVGFLSTLQFINCDVENDLYNFVSLHDKWKRYVLTKKQLESYIEYVTKSYVDTMQYNQTNKIDPKYIDGIVSAWIWYILIMVFALFLKGIVNTVVLWLISTVVFLNWRHNKINGG